MKHVFWEVTTDRLIDRHRCFRASCCLHHQTNNRDITKIFWDVCTHLLGYIRSHLRCNLNNTINN